MVRLEEGVGEQFDEAQLRFASFACRPGCGLCCYTSPRLSPSERTQLLTIAPLEVSSNWTTEIPARPEGGACMLLSDNRCRVHEGRPSPCAMFPVSVHLSWRAQASIVLSCPGVDLSLLHGIRRGGEDAAPTGLAREVAAAAAAVNRVAKADRDRIERRWFRAVREAESGGETVDGARTELLSHLPSVEPEDLGEESLPESSAGVDRLPMFFDERYGRVALAATSQGIEVLVLDERGGAPERLATLPPVELPPRLTARGADLFDSYRRYFVARDAFVGMALADDSWDPATPISERLSGDLHEIGGTVLARARIRALLAGGSGELLDAEEVADGIRATDADYLDRPTVGAWL